MAEHISLDELSPAQNEIINLIWDAGEMSAPQIREKLAENGRVVTRNTIRTMLMRMEEKGWVRHRIKGRTYWYNATHPRKTSIGRKVRELVDRVCGGKPQLLVNALLEEGNLSAKELDAIRALLSTATPGVKSRSIRRKK